MQEANDTIRPSDLVISSALPARSIPEMLNAWLDSKIRKSGSDKTKEAYLAVMQHFRQELLARGLDLDGSPRLIAEVAQSWAGQQHQQETGLVSASTYNQRLSIISSWYRYVLKMYRDEHDIGENPIGRIERPKVTEYEHAEAIDHEVLEGILKELDRKTIQGKQSYALLCIAITTGKRVGELAAMRWSHLSIRGERVTIVFPHTKRGKQMRDMLPIRTSKALLDYLYAWYGAELGQLSANAPIWITLDTNQYHGKQMSVRTMQRLCEKLCAGNFHKLRASFAVAMEKAGAKVSEIQAKLGHESLATTGRYLARLHSAENPYGDRMERLFGMEENEASSLEPES